MPATGSSGTDDAAARLRESLYTAVGFGVLGFQQAQVRRRQLQRELSRLAAEVDERVDPVLDDLEARLSDEVRPLVAQARSAVRTAQRTLLGPPPNK
jgi:C4-dicarboxylate-specific signal transduction histidine kinase